MRLADPDFGTPAVESSESVQLEINGVTVTAPSGSSIMRAAAEAGIPIPKLCATDSTNAFGSCRMCLVQIEGHAGLVSSCTQPVAEGQRVTTQNEELARLRRSVMELYISDHPMDCLTCADNGDCELQDVAGQVGLRQMRYAAGDNHLDDRKDESN
ncbi:MAG: 2Fe-2S iron-sulfur cluster binding domain-containing protein, partial [Gammaproteobacteria bacterium]|nr:2Fe-2S iron-sulfur cluster binding domain-containing protein [Gammaproteobacteria bacterium]